MKLWLSMCLNVLGLVFLTKKPVHKFYFHFLTPMTELHGNNFNSEKSVLLHKGNINTYFNKKIFSPLSAIQIFFIIHLAAKPALN